MTAQFRLVVDEDYFLAGSCRFERGAYSVRAAANHGGGRVVEYVLVGMLRDRVWVFVNSAKARGAADERLGEAPHPGMGEGLVIEAHRHRPRKLLGNCHVVGFQGWVGVLVGDPHAVLDRLLAGADIRGAVHVHQAIGTIARDTQQAARAVVLETAAEDAPAGAIERRGDRVLGQGLDGSTVKGEGDG